MPSPGGTRLLTDLDSRCTSWHNQPRCGGARLCCRGRFLPFMRGAREADVETTGRGGPSISSEGPSCPTGASLPQALLRRELRERAAAGAVPFEEKLHSWPQCSRLRMFAVPARRLPRRTPIAVPSRLSHRSASSGNTSWRAARRDMAAHDAGRRRR